MPTAYKDGAKRLFLIIHDGPVSTRVRHALDNLTISENPNRKLPAFIAIAVENGGQMMAQEAASAADAYQKPSDRLARFINDEVFAGGPEPSGHKGRLPSPRDYGNTIPLGVGAPPWKAADSYPTPRRPAAQQKTQQQNRTPQAMDAGRGRDNQAKITTMRKPDGTRSRATASA